MFFYKKEREVGGQTSSGASSSGEDRQDNIGVSESRERRDGGTYCGK